MSTREKFRSAMAPLPCEWSERDGKFTDAGVQLAWFAWCASRTTALEEACTAILALRESHIADAPTCDYVGCDFVSAWDDAVGVIRAMANENQEG